MPAESVPIWAMTSSSAALFGEGPKSSNGLATSAAADAKPVSSADKANPASSSGLQQPTQTDASLSIATAPPVADAEKPYEPKRKQRPITHCPPLASLASSSPSSSSSSRRIPYSIPYVDEQSANESLHQLIAVQAKRAGYDATTASALHQVSQLTKKFLTSVFTAAMHAAELSCRDQPSARDLIYALETHGQPIRELRDFHPQQLRDGEEQDERNQASAKARGKARENAAAPETYRAKRKSRLRDQEQSIKIGDEQDKAWVEGSNAFLPSDSDDGSELDAWSVSSESDDEYGNRRAAVQVRVAKRKHDLARAQAKRERRMAKLRQTHSNVADPTAPSSSTSSTSAQDLRALISGEQAWRKIADHVVPRHLPGMPPRHAWVQTPAYPTNAYGLSLGGEEDEDGTVKEKKDPLMLVNRKLANARLVEASLKRLIQNTDGAAAVAYAASAKSGGAETPTAGGRESGEQSRAEPASAPSATVPASSSSGGFAVPNTPASSGGSGLTLRLKNKFNLPSSALNSPTQPSTPTASRRASTAVFASTSASGVPGTPLGTGMSMGWGGEPLMSPLTPMSANPGAGGGLMTPYPPTTGGVYGHYFGSNSQAATGGPGGYRSRSQSIVAANADSYAGVLNGPDGNAGADKLGVRVPGPVNYKNVWYAPGSTIASGGLAGGATSGHGAKSGSSSSNHPHSVKRMRKWKV
ncbi:hypothetical protein NDA11_002809 [Ustilago hordei]|uniref:Transcription initiation factor TFIID subunit 8 n=1 Tax=Ustilago hordei TaxID=120017 RepID=I2FN96_USTHO|nr:uncharacterized protein UHO2_07095 [Ustilago hordei]KAJ1572256.1 hypothetical protein NDA11_002809 [Ustilago hordei]KAJ1591352.1 hypothetical protein NDA15_001215 [Ustilago hordei]KAJ1593708.1 hypothetical protein NDA12_006936 [Ustilago hordei]KAJ1604020.1 hypothetical protein NDA14_004789 [Ustilago hordei]CCF48389.1 uncharacterized protein UHOR_08909 [Ustilago hordei]